jgi:hypothetical protein
MMLKGGFVFWTTTDQDNNGLGEQRMGCHEKIAD